MPRKARPASPKHGGGVRRARADDPHASRYRSPGQVKTGTWEGGGGRRGRAGHPGADAVAGRGQVKSAAVAVSAGGRVRDTRANWMIEPEV